MYYKITRTDGIVTIKYLREAEDEKGNKIVIVDRVEETNLEELKLKAQRIESEIYQLDEQLNKLRAVREDIVNKLNEVTKI